MLNETNAIKIGKFHIKISEELIVSNLCRATVNHFIMKDVIFLVVPLSTECLKFLQ